MRTSKASRPAGSAHDDQRFAKLAEDSLGTNLLDMLASKGYDLEVINPDDVMLPPVFAAQNRTNRRILQLHDVWHLFGASVSRRKERSRSPAFSWHNSDKIIQRAFSPPPPP